MAPRKMEKLSKSANRQRLQTKNALKTKVKDRVLGKGKVSRKVSKASGRPMMKIKKKLSKGILGREEARLQKQIEQEGLDKKGSIPAGNISLQKSKQSKFKKQKKLPTKKPQLHDGQRGGGIIYLSNIPHGFFDIQLKKYFGQFGKVTDVRHVRSERTGRSRGFAYVEFQHKEVAMIAAQSMDQYLTYGKIMKCKFIGHTPRLSKRLFSVPRFNTRNCPKVLSRLSFIEQLNSRRTVEQRSKRGKSATNSFNKKMMMLESLGVKLDLKMDVLDPEIEKARNKRRKERLAVKASKTSDDAAPPLTIDEENFQSISAASVNGGDVPSVEKDVGDAPSVEKDVGDAPSVEKDVVFEADQSDDEIVIKTPPFAKKRLVKITATTPAVKVTSTEKPKKNVDKKTPNKTSSGSTPKLEKFNISTPALKTPISRKLSSGTPTAETPKTSTSKTPKLAKSDSKTSTPKTPSLKTPKSAKSVHRIATPKTPQSAKAGRKTATPKTPKLAKTLKTPNAEKPVKTPKANKDVSEEKKISIGKRRKSVAGTGESGNLLKKKRLSF